jgi:DNA helicase-2/ATP-dependent DNA helicase PcrA
VRWKDVEQLQMLATRSADAEHFLADLTLDPPVASGNQAGDPLKDEDFLILSTVHSAKGQEWNSVFLLNVVDGSFPSEFSTGDDRLIEEERRLLYVAATRAKDQLHLMVPLKFYVPQQQRHGAKHVYGAQSRFLTGPLLATCERRFYGEAQSRNRVGEAIAQLDLPSKISELW